MKIISIVNQKGGVGKTATAVSLAHGLVRKGKKTLLIDFDPQGHSTLQCRVNAAEREYLVYDLLKSIDKNDGSKFEEVVCHAENGVDILPCNINMSNADVIISGLPAKELKLKKILKKANLDYDYILIDCPPMLNILTYNALAASNEILIPLQAETSSLDGIAQLLDTIEIVREDINENLEINGVLLTMVDKRLSMYKDVCNVVTQYFGEKKYNSEIRRNIKIAEAYGMRKTVFEYAADSTGAKDYDKFIDEFIKRGEK